MSKFTEFRIQLSNGMRFNVYLNEDILDGLDMVALRKLASSEAVVKFQNDPKLKLRECTTQAELLEKIQQAYVHAVVEPWEAKGPTKKTEAELFEELRVTIAETLEVEVSEVSDEMVTKVQNRLKGKK
jgi:hypothetical protein